MPSTPLFPPVLLQFVSRIVEVLITNRLQLCAVLISMALISFTTPAVAQVSFQPPTFTGMGTVFVADFNNDGKLDLLISDG